MLPASRLQHFPVAFFSMIMGLSGLSIAWDKAHTVLIPDLDLGAVLGLLTGIVFLALALAYAAKLMRFRTAVVAELHHPIKLNFYPTISISLILLSIVSLERAPALAQGLWLVGTGLHLVLTLYVMSVWIHHKHFRIEHMNPAWFIPVVGNALVPITGCGLGFDELSWFFFSIGVVFWLVLMTIFFNRVFFHEPLPEKLMPTFFILIAPPAVAFLAYMKLQHAELDVFARILYYSGLFLTLLLLTQVGRFARLNFSLSWWAYSFPLSAITVATLVMAQVTGQPFFTGLGWVLLGLLSVVVAYLVLRTTRAVMVGKICQPE
ncbi:SLAC1 anion channel family protein [Sedimenticola selenatireducens]|uniref:C4-dicarboxylate ABC transporter n=1 Tax=Sedimenticola selenatireducens TaxID=191960 RepID=A0A557S1A7_9GAMM|nr:SLAC1 anion channel family protein [Sedimenticola selenatireducens]TVO71210.1 C4-dicarboxylate ABC transporter [Sedimenticola selenatireducens]TVT61512.1 MAG: C4-dicarboxylate ABC transporter [Sedimenticola selenatireducens]